jgi:hypothetical protein
MNKFIFLLLALGVAICLSIVFSRFLMKNTEPLAPVTLAEEQPRPSPSVAKLVQPVISDTTRTLQADEVAALYKKQEDVRNNYQTIQVKTQFEILNILDAVPLNTEIDFAAVRPDRFIHHVVWSQPSKRGDPGTTWEMKPKITTLLDGNILREVTFEKRKVHRYDLAPATDEMKKIMAPIKRRADRFWIDPFSDFLCYIPTEELLKEFQSGVTKNSEKGEQAVVLFRISAPFRDILIKGRTAAHLPIRSKVLETVTMREDVIDLQTGLPDRITYFDRENKPFLIETYSEITLNQEIPPERFIPILPENARLNDMNLLFENSMRKKLDKATLR